MILIQTRPGRRCGWALLFLVTLFAPRLGAEPRVRFTTAERGKALVVEVTALPAADLESLRQAKDVDWPALLSIRVVDASSELLGTHTVGKETLRFESRYPPAPGLRFRAIFDPRQLPGRPPAKPISAEATVARTPFVAKGVVGNVYPSADKLPENQLRFYIHFSVPMSRHEAYAHVKLLDEKGKEIAGPFLELGEELWDEAGKRFTLYLHPGRVKRELKPREELGPVLEEGKRYTLVVAATWPDAEGNPLKSDYRKNFRVGAAHESQPDPTNWELTAPALGDREPVRLQFPKPLDHALLHDMLWVSDPNGSPVAGTIGVGDQERRWSFTPSKPWTRGRHKIVIDTALEDSAGNSIARPFEFDLVEPRPRDKPRLTELFFDVK